MAALSAQRGGRGFARHDGRLERGRIGPRHVVAGGAQAGLDVHRRPDDAFDQVILATPATEAAIGPMRELHKLTHQPVNLSVRQGDEIVYIERTYSERSGMQVVRAVGGRAPLHLTSVGKLFLAHDEPQRVRAYATRTGLTGHTRNSLTELPSLERELEKVRRTAVSRDDEELELGVRCMAAGIYDDQGRLVAGLSISAPADRLEESWLERVKDTAARISAALGHGSGA